MVYFDNAATSRYKPEEVRFAVAQALKYYSANPGRSGHDLAMKVTEQIYETRVKIADFFGAENPEAVVFTVNCTMAANLALKGVLNSGDKVIISDIEHNAVARPAFALSKNEGVLFETFKTYKKTDEEIVKDIESKITPNTKMIECIHASNVFGLVMPVEKIGKLCKEKGLLFAVDAAQTAGVLPVDMQKMNIDYLFVAPHKGLMAPMGTGILIARKPINKTVIEGGTGYNSAELFQSTVLPENFESGTPNVPGILGIDAGIEYLNKKGIENIYEHELSLVKYLYKLFKNSRKITLYTGYPEREKYVPVLSFNVNGYTGEEVGEYLNKAGFAVRTGLHCSPLAHETYGTKDKGTVRVSPGITASKRQIEIFAEVIGKIDVNFDKYLQ